MRKYQHHILYIVVIAILFSLIIISNSNIDSNNSSVSALSYSSSVGIGFTFIPTLSVNISPSDLTISNLSPGTTADSNIINVSVATNAAYGYTLSANVNNESLVHSNNINTFNSIATDADLSDLEDSEDANIWGYSTSLDSGTTWSNYNGLSNSSNTALINTNSNTSSNLDFKIAAKAASTQPSGTYAGTINFTAVSNVAPMSLLDSFIASGAEQLNGYFRMQDMTHSICSNVDIEESELQLIDVRDNKIYWVAKLKDGNCWMTQNLDLDIGNTNILPLNSNNTDISTESELYGANSIYSDYIMSNGVYTWNPDATAITSGRTIDFSGSGAALVSNWVSNSTEPYSAEGGDTYLYTSNTNDVDIKYASLADCEFYHSNCEHYHVGNYYNWTAAIASNSSVNISTIKDANNSICPKNWMLPIENGITRKYDFGNLLVAQKIKSNPTDTAYLEDGFYMIRVTPLWFVRSGYIYGDKYLGYIGAVGYYWSSTAQNDSKAYALGIGATYVSPLASYPRYNGQSVRCVAR